MKKLTLLLLLLSYFAASGQHPLSRGRRTSVYEYLYSLSNEEALQICSRGPRKINTSYLHTLKDSFPHDKGVPDHLPPGNYLSVYAENDQVKTVFLYVPNVYVKLAYNNHDLIAILHDQKGNLVKDAQVKIKNQHLHYDTKAGAWLYKKYKRSGLLQVYYKGMLNCVDVNPAGFYYRQRFPRSVLNKINYAFSDHKRYRRSYYDNWYGNSKYELQHRGYIVFSKPVYKPGDTLKVKAYLTDKKGRPVNKPLLLRLSDRDYITDTILTTLAPYTPGGYSYEVVISPEMDLQLDNEYRITFETTDSRKYDLDEYDGDLDEEAYAAKRQLLIQGRFQLEEYELHTLVFNARTDKALHTRREKLAVYLQARDENELPVMDGQIQLFVTQPTVLKSYSRDMLVPDTLWQYKGPIDVVGETKVIVPDSVFPEADLSYRIECILTNSDNERKYVTLEQEYRYEQGRFSFKMQGDSLHITLEGDDQANSKVDIYGVNEAHDTVETYTTQLPAAIKINPFLAAYEVQGKNAKDSYTLEQDPDLLNCKVSWRNDTAMVLVDNPHKLSFWYTIFEHKKVIQRGYGDALSWQASTRHNKQYELRVSYVWKGGIKNIPVFFKDPGNQLNISVDAPRIVYPGQTTEITVNVRDKYEKPVAETDVTAYAYTSKFTDDKSPVIPSFTTRHKSRKSYRLFQPLPTAVSPSALPFEWERYRKSMGLDSLLFFRFTHPAPVFTYTEPTDDHTTQIAPFVFARGSIQPVHILYVDEVPVYFSMTNPVQAYSVRIRAGKHTIKVRTAYQEISLEQVIADGVKTFISIDSAIHQQNVSVKAMPQQLTAPEAARVENYLIRLNDTFGNFPAYLTQHSKLYNLNASGSRAYNYGQYIVGPLDGTEAALVAKDHFTQYFKPESGYTFEISRGLIKQKQTSARQYNGLHYYRPDTSLSAQVLTEKAIDSTIRTLEDDKLRKEDVHPYATNTRSYPASLSIRLASPEINPGHDVLGFLFFRYDDPSFVKPFKGYTTAFRYLDSGYYRLVVLLTGKRYFEKDSILLKEDHVHYYTFDTLTILPQHSAISRLEKGLRDMHNQGATQSNRQIYGSSMAENFNTDQVNAVHLNRIISGVVVDKRGDPLPGVTILLKGSRSGTQTDLSGNFTLHVTTKGILEVRYIGFSSVQKRLNNDDFYRITLEEDEKALQEVVVTGMGIKREKARGYTLGTVTSEEIQIRGVSSFAAALSGKAAGVKLRELGFHVQTRQSGMAETDDAEEIEIDEPPAPPASSLRTRFRDDAFWQPGLRTDVNGKATFKVTFPDDITSWKAYTIAMNGKRQSAITRTFIRSYKTLSGNLALPQFSVAGDSMLVISKALNYTPETIAVTRTFQVNDSTYRTGNISFKNAFIDTVPVVIKGGDSVSFRYTVNKEAYMDGEQRKIPVVKRGTEETTGMFAALYNDTSFTYTPPHPGPLQIYAASAVLPALMDEIRQVQRYRYLCNEQLASKLKAYLLEKKVAAYLKKDFDKDKDIKDILNRLDRQKKNGLWGWWENSPVSVWISRHVIEALLMAEEQQYPVSLNKQATIDYFVDELNTGREWDTIGCMQLLARLGAKINYASYADSIIARSGNRGYDTIRLALLQREVGLPLNLSPILARGKNTVYGNAYWGNESYDLFNNSIQKTLQVYKLLRQTGGYEPVLQRIRGYFLEQRKDGHWRNTYESSLILETILPDVLEDESHGPAALDINGRHITRLPYTDTLTVAGKINISKQGKRPVYFTAYQQFFNEQPEKLSGQFAVSAVFKANNATQKDLKAGVPVTLKVDVTVQKTADYILVEIPIPAGCSYSDKSQSRENNEVHREHFKDRVSIFCSQLRPGTYTFNVSLLPRYSGRYYLNPAKAEMQYFPVFMGREALKEINIH